jgi:hypothetical protein
VPTGLAKSVGDGQRADALEMVIIVALVADRRICGLLDALRNAPVVDD